MRQHPNCSPRHHIWPRRARRTHAKQQACQPARLTLIPCYLHGILNRVSRLPSNNSWSSGAVTPFSLVMSASSRLDLSCSAFSSTAFNVGASGFSIGSTAVDSGETACFSPEFPTWKLSAVSLTSTDSSSSMPSRSNTSSLELAIPFLPASPWRRPPHNRGRRLSSEPRRIS